MSHVFISYSTQNSNYAYQLADKLRDEGFDIWIDNRELRSSDNWWESIVKALRGCAAFIVIMTPESRTSKWVQREVTLADNWQKPTFPILLAGDNWEIFVLTQFENVRLEPNPNRPPQYAGKLPPAAFYDKLAEYATPNHRAGENVVQSGAATYVEIDEELAEEIANPPPLPETTPPPHLMAEASPSADYTPPRRLPITPRAGLIVAGVVVVALFAIALVSQLTQPQPSPTPTQATQQAQIATNTSAAVEPTQAPLILPTDRPTFTVTPSSTPTNTQPPTATLLPTIPFVVPQGQQPDGSIVHTVQPGDTIDSIAYAYGVSRTDIMQLNNIKDPRIIHLGQKLLIKPAPTEASKGSFEYGGHVTSTNSDTAANAMRRAGMTWMKVQIRYTNGMSPSAAQEAINDAHSWGFKLLVAIPGVSSELAAGGGYIQQYTAFLAGVAGYGPDAIEVWNEMNLDREWPTGQISGATYTDMLRQAYQAIKGANSSVMVISGALAPTGAEGAYPGSVVNDDHFLRDMVAAGALQYMDCLGAHYAEGIVGPDQSSGDPRDNYYTRYFSAMLDTYWNISGGQKPICFTELGYLTPEGYGPLDPFFAWAQNTTVAQQAAWLAQAAELSSQGGKVRLMIVWNIDFTEYGSDPKAGYAIIRPGGGCPACDAFAVAR
jgi:LysM repeat protein